MNAGSRMWREATLSLFSILVRTLMAGFLQNAGSGAVGECPFLLLLLLPRCGVELYLHSTWRLTKVQMFGYQPRSSQKFLGNSKQCNLDRGMKHSDEMLKSNMLSTVSEMFSSHGPFYWRNFYLSLRMWNSYDNKSQKYILKQVSRLDRCLNG